MTTRMERRTAKGGARAGKHVRRRGMTPARIALITAVVLVVVLAGAAFALVQIQAGALRGGERAGGKESPLPQRSIAATDGAETTATASADATLEVEVPDVLGHPVEKAEIILESAGFTVATRVADQQTAGVEPGSVVALSPSAGARLKTGSRVIVTYNPKVAQTTQPAGLAGSVVCIDAGHQRTADLSLEPIGPGSTEMKEKVRGGATGVATRVPEYQRTLEVSMRLKEKLEAAGVKVVMVRTANEVNVANSERALIGNRAGAHLTVRVHFDSSNTQSVRGISTLYPAGNAWCAPIEGKSRRAAELVENAACATTGAKNRGIFGRADMTGFNWSTVPTIIVEGGFMSNPEEDKLIGTPAYQDKLAQGIADGVLRYLSE